MSEAYEFYAPFAHIPGRYEWARIHSPSHGSFDCFIVIEQDTQSPVTVYVATEAGERFMADRYPESTCHRLEPEALTLMSDDGGYRVAGSVVAPAGPIRSAAMTFTASAHELPRAEAYGGDAVWGSRYSCRGVDLHLPAAVVGAVTTAEQLLSLTGAEGLLALGSYGLITERS
jgi:hypothetical protein